VFTQSVLTTLTSTRLFLDFARRCIERVRLPLAYERFSNTDRVPPESLDLQYEAWLVA
jgi:hypothetical protein